MSGDGGTGSATSQATSDAGGATGSGGAAGATTDTTTATGQTAVGSGGSSGGFDTAGWEALARDTGMTADQIKERLSHARTWEQRAKDNKGAADQLPTLQQQLDQVRKDLADRDVRDVERSGRLAMAQVRAGLANARVSEDDVKDLLAEIDSTRLLKDGEPDEQAINRIVGALSRAAGRPVPDRDQGQRGAAPATDMNTLIRRAAGMNV